MRTFAFVHHDEPTLLVVSAITLFPPPLSDSAWVVPYSCWVLGRRNPLQ
jgi:hypothetical protein